LSPRSRFTFGSLGVGSRRRWRESSDLLGRNSLSGWMKEIVEKANVLMFSGLD